MEYGHLLHTAASLDEPLHRLQVSCFVWLFFLYLALCAQVENWAEIMTIAQFRLGVEHEYVLEPD